MPNLPSGLTNRTGLPTGLTGAEKAGSWKNIKAQPNLLDQIQQVVNLQKSGKWIEPGVYTHLAKKAGVDPGNWQAFKGIAQTGSLLDQLAGGGGGGGNNALPRDAFDMGGGPGMGTPGNVAPSFGENGQTDIGNAIEGLLGSTLGQLSDPALGIPAVASVGTGSLLGFLAQIAKGMLGENNNQSMVDQITSMTDPQAIANANDLGVGMGQGVTGTGVPAGIGPQGIPGQDDASVAAAIAAGLNGGGPGGGGTGAPGGAPGAAPGSPGDAVGGAGMGGPGIW